MLPVVISSSLHLARTQEAIIPAVGVLNPWALAAIAAPVAFGATVSMVRAHALQRKEANTELEQLLRDFSEGR